MTFKEYVGSFDVKIRQGGNFRDALFFDAQFVDIPARDDLVSFLSKLIVALQSETGRQGGAKDAAQIDRRGKAIEEIARFVESGSTGVFAGINKYLFAFQLAQRVRSPHVMEQRQTMLCGPVALVFDVAKRDPERYARFAISLFSTGSGQLGAATITASSKIRSGYQPGYLFPPGADYVVLASMRDTDAITSSSAWLRDILTLTKPGALCEFMQRAGYRNVQDHTFLKLSTTLKIFNAFTRFPLYAPGHNPFDQGEKNLLAAQQEFNNGRAVIINADGEVAKALMYGQGKYLELRQDALIADQTHWTAVRRLQITGDKIRIKVVTWGRSAEGTVPKDAFLSRYAGYVSADP